MYDPEPGRARDVLALVNEIPLAFFRLSAFAGEMFADLGLGPPERGALRTLFVDGQRSAPDFAMRKPVSREIVEPLLDGLVARGLVRTEPSPEAGQPKIYVLTQQGIDVCVEIQRRELDVIDRLIPKTGEADFGKAAAALAALNTVLGEDLDARR